MANVNQSGREYQGLNNRFRKRAKRLAALGFEYVIFCEGIAGFTRKRHGRVKNIPAATLLLATNAQWLVKLRQTLA